MHYLLCILSFTFLVQLPHGAGAQTKEVYDERYYETFPHMLTTRVYYSHKYTNLQFKPPPTAQRFLYNPNTSHNMGIGVTYQFLTLNLGVGVFNDKSKERTKSLDLQSHIYTRKWVADIFGQFYKGYYLSPRGRASGDPTTFYERPDIGVTLLGTAAYRLFNPEKFSYRAALLQNEWQKRSAGTFLLGGELYYGTIKGDSALIPTTISEGYPQSRVVRTRFLELGPGIGYAYTGVYKEHYFLTGSLTMNADLSFVKEEEQTNAIQHTSISPNIIFRVIGGYNSQSWSANFSWVANRVSARGGAPQSIYRIRAGNYRITLTKRFKPGKKLRERLQPIDALSPF